MCVCSWVIWWMVRTRDNTGQVSPQASGTSYHNQNCVGVCMCMRVCACVSSKPTSLCVVCVSVCRAGFQKSSEHGGLGKSPQTRTPSLALSFSLSFSFFFFLSLSFFYVLCLFLKTELLTRMHSRGAPTVSHTLCLSTISELGLVQITPAICFQNRLYSSGVSCLARAGQELSDLSEE